MTAAAAPVRAGRREWLGFLVLALPCLVYAIDLTVLNLAVPAISADLHPSGSQALWMVDIYGFMVAGALITMGTLGDRIGARRLLLAGGAAFAGASVLATLATSAPMMIAARALLGLAGATIAPSTLSLIRRLFSDDGQRSVAIGLWVASYSLGAAVGPVVGGILLEAFGWRSVFLMALPIMALLLAAGPVLLPEQRERQPGRIDLTSAALSLVAVLAAVYGLKQLATSTGTLAGATWIAAGVALGTAFARRQLRLAEPLIDLRLFRNATFSVALGANLITFFVLAGMALLVVQFMQSVLGLSALAAGAWMVPSAIAFIVASMLTPRLAAHVSAATYIAGAVVLSATGYLVVAGADGQLAPIVAGTTLGGLGLAAVVTIVTDIAVGAVAPEHAGAAAATSETSSELGGALGLALLGSLGAAVYRAGLPAGVPDAARETVGAAVAARSTTPNGIDVATAGADAFTSALTVTATVSGLALLVLAVAVLAVLHRPVAATTAAGAPVAP
jgi:MFS transporter, DHA2 family, multidrug resistance protein